MYACIYELRKNCRGTGGRVDGDSKVLQEVLADLKLMFTFAIMLISQMRLALLVGAGFNVRCLDRVQTAPLH